MKDVRGKARKLIELLVGSTDDVKACLKTAGVASATFYGERGWSKDPVFLEAWREAKLRFESELRSPFASKRRRIEELTRLYDATPDESLETWPSHVVREKGKDPVVVDGGVRRVWLNVNEKRQIIDQIRKELEGDALFFSDLGDAGTTNPLDADLLDRRRKEAAAIDAWLVEQAKPAKKAKKARAKKAKKRSPKKAAKRVNRRS